MPGARSRGPGRDLADNVIACKMSHGPPALEGDEDTWAYNWLTFTRTDELAALGWARFPSTAARSGSAEMTVPATAPTDSRTRLAHQRLRLRAL